MIRIPQVYLATLLILECFRFISVQQKKTMKTKDNLLKSQLNLDIRLTRYIRGYQMTHSESRDQTQRLVVD